MEFTYDFAIIGSFHKLDVIKNFSKYTIGELNHILDYQMSFSCGQFEPK